MSLAAWSGVLLFSLVFIQAIAHRFSLSYGFLFGCHIGVVAGAAMGMCVASANSRIAMRGLRQHIDRILHEHIQPDVIYQPDPIAVEALGRLTDGAVLGGFCCFCGSEHEGLRDRPYHPKHHRTNPLCPVPLSRKIYEASLSVEREEAITPTALPVSTQVFLAGR